MKISALIYICSFATLLANTAINSAASDKIYPVPLNAQGLPAKIRDNVIAQFIDGNGKLIDVHTTSPGTPPVTTAAILNPPSSAVIISGVPAFKWTYGCSPTAVGMLCGFWDRSGFPNIYTGNINAGVCPLNNSEWGGSSECSFIASHKGVDGRTTKGHVDDYWYSLNSKRDPYYSKWVPHSQPGTGDCLADFMATSQYYNHTYPNTDGSTLWAYNMDGSPRVMNVYGFGSYGVRKFIESRGYQLTYYNQYIKGLVSNTQGFTFQNYMSEIDAGRPVIISTSGHTMLGVGYNASNSKVYLHDTWDYNLHEMTWGQTYDGQPHYGVSVFAIAAPPTPPCNDHFDNALSLADHISGSTQSSNIAATSQSNEPDHYTPAKASAWWRWSAKKNGEVTFNTFGSDFDTTIAAYIGSSLTSLTLIQKNDDSDGSLQSKLCFLVTAGSEYYIAVDGYSGSVGAISLNWDLEYLEVSNSTIIDSSNERSLRLNFHVRKGAHYTIKKRDSLTSTTPWQNLDPPMTFTACSDGAYQVDIAIPADSKNAFFKVVRESTL